MDIETLFIDLSESDDISMSIGDVYHDEDNSLYLVPFLHCSVHYLVYLMPVESDQISLHDFEKAIQSHCPSYRVTDVPYALKFGLKDNYRAEKMFEASSVAKVTGVLHTMSTKLAMCTGKLVDAAEAREIFFLPGSECDEHQRRLDLWYKRIDRSIPERYGLTQIHNDLNGGWYGYKRID